MPRKITYSEFGEEPRKVDSKVNPSKRPVGWKWLYCAAAAAVLLIAVGFGIFSLFDHGAASVKTVRDDPARKGASASAAASTGKSKTQTDAPAWDVDSDTIRLNTFLTFIVEQNIENTETELDEDAELVRFAFNYRKYNDAKSILEQKDGDVVSCRTLTLEQVNETLNQFFGKTISPNREDYSILTDGSECFHCVYGDGCFRNIPPYPLERFDFPLRFALVDRVNEKTCTLHFRLYRMNPDAWGEGEAERHVPFLPMMSFYDVESGNAETRYWITKIGQGNAVLQDLGEDLKLIKLSVTMN